VTTCLFVQEKYTHLLTYLPQQTQPLRLQTSEMADL